MENKNSLYKNKLKLYKNDRFESFCRAISKFDCKGS